MAIALLSGPNDPSQLQNALNALITTLNGMIGGTPGGPGVVTALQSGTTGSNLPTSGLVTLASTVAGAAYVLPNPTPGILGQTVQLVTISTKSQTVAGRFNSGNTKLTFKTTRGTGGSETFQSAILTALSTALGWAITSLSGTVKST